MIVLQPNTGKIPESHFDIYNFDGTNSDFEYLLNQGRKHTLHDGEIIMSPPPPKKNKIFTFPICMRLSKSFAQSGCHTTGIKKLRVFRRGGIRYSFPQ